MELRTNPAIQITSRSKEGVEYLDGYAAVFNERTVIWYFEELIAPGAFERALGEKQDVRTLFNHDANYPLARTKNDSLILREDSKGLWTESKLSKNATSDSVADYVRTGLVSGMSFAFTVKRQEWIFQENGSDQMDQRVITEIGTLYDVGPVTYPAYEQTSIKMRKEAKSLHEEARSRWDTRRSVFQVPVGFELVCREARGQEAEEWTDDEKDHDFRESRGGIDEEKPAKVEGEETPKPTVEEGGEGEVKDGEVEGSRSEEVDFSDVEARLREIGIKRRRLAASATTRRAV